MFVYVLFACLQVSAYFIEGQSENLAIGECVIPEINCQTLGRQWTLWNTGQQGAQYIDRDLKAFRALALGYTGLGINIKTVDDGINFCSPDLKSNFDPQHSFNLVGNNTNVFNTGNHGTAIASIIAGDLSSPCTIGIAPKVNIASARINTSQNNDKEVAQALSDDSGTIDIYCASWGPTGVGGPGSLTMAALERGITMGRDGKGSIFSFAAGNGGPQTDCSSNGYINNLWAIGVGSLQVNGEPTPTDTPCSAKVISTYVADSMGRNVLMANTGELCDDTFGDSSGSNAQLCGIEALALQSNSALTWLDVLYILILTSNPTGLAGPWQTNGAGFVVSRHWGFGVPDAEAVISRARTWKVVPQHITDTYTPPDSDGSTPYNKFITYTGKITYLNIIIVIIDMEVPENSEGIVRGDLQVELTSPMGTTSLLLPQLIEDRDPGKYTNHYLKSVHSFGENPGGNWTLNITAGNSTIANVGKVQYIFFGSATIPEAVTESNNCDEQCARGCSREGALNCDSCRILRNASTLECITSCPTPYVGQAGICFDPNNMKREDRRSQKSGSLARCGAITSARTSVWLLLAAIGLTLYLLA